MIPSCIFVNRELVPTLSIHFNPNRPSGHAGNGLNEAGIDSKFAEDFNGVLSGFVVAYRAHHRDIGTAHGGMAGNCRRPAKAGALRKEIPKNLTEGYDFRAFHMS